MVELNKLEENIKITFNNKELLLKALIHRSYLNENSEYSEHNERLEFLGDAVLELVVTEYLYKIFSNPEGDLTNWRSALVKGEHLAKLAKKINLGDFLLLSKGEERSGGRKKNYILANAFEALIGAIYLDQGYKEAECFINKNVLVDLNEILAKNLHIDAKSLFQEKAQDKREITPVYNMLHEEGPDHDKVFTMGVYLGEELVAEGTGGNKQAAEQAAAKAALIRLGWE